MQFEIIEETSASLADVGVVEHCSCACCCCCSLEVADVEFE